MKRFRKTMMDLGKVEKNDFQRIVLEQLTDEEFLECFTRARCIATPLKIMSLPKPELGVLELCKEETEMDYVQLLKLTAAFGIAKQTINVEKEIVELKQTIERTNVSMEENAKKEMEKINKRLEACKTDEEKTEVLKAILLEEIQNLKSGKPLGNEEETNESGQGERIN